MVTGFGSARLITVIRQYENIFKRIEATQKFVAFTRLQPSYGFEWKALQAAVVHLSPFHFARQFKAATADWRRTSM
jgi:hypothetical protein